MSATDPYTFLKAQIAQDEAEAYARSRPAKESRPPLLVTVSRDYGAGGELIARNLAECLGIPVHDREILELAAQKAKIDAFRLESHDENFPGKVSMLVYSLLTSAACDIHVYRRALCEAVHELAQRDGLLVWRGAHLILAGHKVFRVRVVGSRLVCARRLSQETGMPLQEAEHKVYEINNKRHKSIDNLFSDSYAHCSLEFAKNFDLIVNTDHIPAEDAVPILLMGMQQAGFELRTAARQP